MANLQVTKVPDHLLLPPQRRGGHLLKILGDLDILGYTGIYTLNRYKKEWDAPIPIPFLIQSFDPWNDIWQAEYEVRGQYIFQLINQHCGLCHGCERLRSWHNEPKRDHLKIFRHGPYTIIRRFARVRK